MTVDQEEELEWLRKEYARLHAENGELKALVRWFSSKKAHEMVREIASVWGKGE